MSRGTVMALFLHFWMLSIICHAVGIATVKFIGTTWFHDMNISTTSEDRFWRTFQQHRNVNKHMHWLSNEISAVNRQIKLAKDQLSFVIQSRERLMILNHDMNTPIDHSSDNNEKETSFSIEPLKNPRNVYVLQLIADDPLFRQCIKDLNEIYQPAKSLTIECISLIGYVNTTEKHIFLKVSNGDIHLYRINGTKLFVNTLGKNTQPISVWNNQYMQLEFYRRFVHDNQTDDPTVRLIDIQNRPKLTDVHFFTTMGQMLLVKYRVDASSLSCILEFFFEHIYTCDGRLIHPHELKLLTDDRGQFVFYAILMNTATERQIYPLELNYHIRHGDHIFFLYSNHPQFHALSAINCPDCKHSDRTIFLQNQIENIESANNQIKEPQKSILDYWPSEFSSQNYIVYFVVSIILFYMAFSVYHSHQESRIPPPSSFAKKHSISSRRGR